jgi:hypothetical protein
VAPRLGAGSATGGGLGEADSQARSPTAQPVSRSTAAAVSAPGTDGSDPTKQSPGDTHGFAEDHGYVARSLRLSTPIGPVGCGVAV